MKVVVDTNVLVSGIINVQDAPGRIVDLIRARELKLVVDDRILAEYRHVLLRERLRRWFTEEDARDLLAFLFLDSERIVPTIIVKDLPDPGDRPFLEVAMTAGVPLITGNSRHFPESLCRGHKVLTPAEFVRQK